MKYVFDLTQKQLHEIKRIINTRNYDSVSQFLYTAVENQIHLEKSNTIEYKESKPKEIIRAGTVSENIDIIKLENINTSPKLVAKPNFHSLSASLLEISEEKCWLWGQVNKILPIKIGVRYLYANIDSQEWIELENYKQKTAKIAADLGELIRRYEKEKNKKRNDKISAGLPKKRSFKSKERYKNHFLASIRKNNKLDGTLPFLKLVNLRKDEKDTVSIGLTEEGLKFASLSNPVIDSANFDKSLDSDEVNFYLNHISQNVKGEYYAIKWLLSILKNGINQREQINEKLKEDFSQYWDGVSDKVINTQRAGLMARMYELGLIEKQKQGIRVIYKITSEGKQFLR